MKQLTSGMRSKLEERIAANLDEEGIDYEYEPLASKVRYTVPESKHIYTPDFVITTRSGNRILIEGKGIWDYKDRHKHLLIREQHPNLDIRFIFQRSKQRIRKGSRTTYADICNGDGKGIFKDVIWQFSDGTIPREWFN